MTDETHDLDTLGHLHTRLQAQLKDVRDKLAPAIRAEQQRDPSVTLLELVQRSGYRSLETVRQILDPKRREEINKRRKRGGAE